VHAALSPKAFFPMMSLTVQCQSAFAGARSLLTTMQMRGTTLWLCGFRTVM
jgi:hypothetical protein